jgi:hypothetical protein
VRGRLTPYIGRPNVGIEERLMKRLIGFGVGVVFALAMASGFGCALTNYELITDTDGRPVNTAGAAYVKQETQFATTYPDGSDNLLWYVEQKANGDRRLSTVNYFSAPGAASLFKDDQYCSPEPMGCKIVTADDPEIGDVDDYDYRENPSCAGYRSLVLLISATRETGECGRTASVGNALKMLGLAAGMTPVKVNGAEWLEKNLSARNTSIVLDNRRGDAYTLPLTTTVTVRANFAKRQVQLDLTSPNTRDDFQNAIAWSRAHPAPDGFVATITVDGVDLTYRVKFARDAASAIDRRYR